MTITINHPTRERRRLRTLIAAGGVTLAVTLGAYGVVHTLTSDDAATSGVQSQPAPIVHPVAVDIGPLAEWARANGVTGLSPASATHVVTNDAIDTRPVAEWARAHGISGLSPASATSNAGK